MSAELEQLEQDFEGAENEVCASCGIAAVDDVKLKDCDGGCDLVKYCSNKCQENRRVQHEEECNKRRIEMHDKDLFTQPDISHWGECPLCFLPLPVEPRKSMFYSCCSNLICIGCNYANMKREVEQGLQRRCAFCREPTAKSDEEYDKQAMERIKKNDPVAMTKMGKHHYNKKEYGKAVEYLMKAAELGDVEAHCCLGRMYLLGHGVVMDEEKAVYHLEQAAIGGHPIARNNLACYEIKNDRFERAARHSIIAAKLGEDTSLREIKYMFLQGIVSKDDYAAALRGHQAAVDATKSAEREKADFFYKDAI